LRPANSNPSRNRRDKMEGKQINGVGEAKQDNRRKNTNKSRKAEQRDKMNLQIFFSADAELPFTPTLSAVSSKSAYCSASGQRGKR
jgi:hypothetical protein